MYLLPCPKCDSSLSISPSQAGDTTACPECAEPVSIPKLGELRKLPTNDAQSSTQQTVESDASTGGRIGFVIFSFLALMGMLITGFCGIRWSLVQAKESTESHLQAIEDTYPTLTPAKLVREFEDMEKYGLNYPLPYTYKTKQLEKQSWRNGALAGGALCFASALVALLLLRIGRNTQPSGTDT